MAGAWCNRNSDGTLPRVFDGTTPRVTADGLPCCCTTPASCEWCDAPLPAAYDCEFTSVSICPGHSLPGGGNSPTTDTYEAFGTGSDQVCRWGAGNFPEELSHPWGVGVSIVGEGGGVSSAGVRYQEDTAPPGYTYFRGIQNPYGPDCTATILVSNLLTSSANCDLAVPFIASNIQAGYGGSAACVAILPP